MAKDSEQTGIIVAGVVALVIIANIRGLFQGIGRGLGIGSETSEEKDRAGAAEVAQAARFDEPATVPEIWTARALTDAAANGTITADDISAIMPHADLIGRMAVQYHEAKGTFWDDEAAAVSAVGAMRSIPMLLAMGETFFQLYGLTLGAYGQTFLERGHKAAIVGIIEKVRKG